MHIFNMSVTYMQKAEKIQWKLLEELFHKVFTNNHNLLKALRGVFIKYVLSVTIQTSYCKNYKVA